MAKNWRRKAVLVKIESSYGVDSAPTGSANAMLLTDVELRPMEGSDTSRNLEMPHLGAQPQIATELRAVLTASIELVGSGTAGIAPAWGPMARACGLAEVIVEDASVTYTPISTAMESVTVHAWVDGVLHVLRGARGTAEITVTAQQIPRMRVTLTGLWSAPTEGTMPTADFEGFRAPVVATSVNTPIFTMAGVALVLREYRLDLGCQVEPRLLIGREEILITNRQEMVSATVEAVSLATLNPFTQAQDHNTTIAGTITHGTVAGHRTTIATPRLQMMRLEGYSPQQDIVEWPLRARPLPSSTGNDQFSITLT